MEQNQTSIEKKSVRERSSSYPSATLEDAVTYSKKLISAFGKTPFNRDSAAAEMGHQSVSGAAGMKISSLVHFGLLDREGNSYKNSQLAFKIAHPVDEAEQAELLKEAARMPKLYKTLLNTFSGQAIPSALSSILLRNHGINRNVADDAGRAFVKTLEYSRLIVNGIVENPPTDDGSIPVAAPESADTRVQQSQQSHSMTPTAYPSQNKSTDQNILVVELPCGIALSYPKSLAYSFSIGTFGSVISSLNNAVEAELKKRDSTSAGDDVTEV